MESNDMKILFQQKNVSAEKLIISKINNVTSKSGRWIVHVSVGCILIHVKKN